MQPELAVLALVSIAVVTGSQGSGTTKRKVLTSDYMDRIYLTADTITSSPSMAETALPPRSSTAK